MDELLGAPLGSLRALATAHHGRAKVEDALAEACGLGLEHLPLSRRLEALAAGEWQRLQLASCLSSGLTGILYILEGLGSQLSGEMLDAVAARRGRRLLLGVRVLHESARSKDSCYRCRRNACQAHGNNPCQAGPVLRAKVTAHTKPT